MGAKLTRDQRAAVCVRSAGCAGSARARAHRHDLVEGFVAADHAELAARALFDGRHAGLEVRHFGDELLVALHRLGVLRLLALHRFRQARELAARRRRTARAGTAAAIRR